MTEFIEDTCLNTCADTCADKFDHITVHFENGPISAGLRL